MLRAGSKFRGTQQSDSQKYSVEVDIKTVDMSESFVCGYLKIEGPSIASLLRPTLLIYNRPHSRTRDLDYILRRGNNWPKIYLSNSP